MGRVAGDGSVVRVIDLRDFAFDPAFRQTSMIKFSFGGLASRRIRSP
jgi:hypothetical protein